MFFLFSQQDTVVTQLPESIPQYQGYPVPDYQNKQTARREVARKNPCFGKKNVSHRKFIAKHFALCKT
jgi:hypothetical protein